MKIEVRPASREDIVAFCGDCRQTVRAYVGVQNGEVIALGGLSFIRGRVVAFCDLGDQARHHPKTLHQVARRVMKKALDAGYKHVFALRDEGEPTAPRWLTRLGFRPIDETERVYLWQH